MLRNIIRAISDAKVRGSPELCIAAPQICSIPVRGLVVAERPSQGWELMWGSLEREEWGAVCLLLPPACLLAGHGEECVELKTAKNVTAGCFLALVTSIFIVFG